MKKFLMYVVVLVTLLFVGYTTYYFVRNNEVISLTLAEDEAIYINVGKTYEMPISWTKPYSSTTVFEEENVNISDTSVISYSSTTKLFTGVKGGKAVVTVTPSNEHFGPFTFTINVGDGSVSYPFYIETKEQLDDIGSEEFPLLKSYKLVQDIDLKSFDNWTPIGDSVTPFSGNFDGNNKLISNMKITSGNNVGLFGEISSTSVVSNVLLSNAIIEGSFDNAGGIAGINNGTIRHCEVSDLRLTNNKDNSNNGGIAGTTQNTSTNNQFTSFGYIDMCTVSVSAETAGNFGGFTGYLAGSVIYNSVIKSLSYKTLDNSTYFGVFVGTMQDAINSDTYMFSVIKNSYAIVANLRLENTNTKAGAVAGKNIDTVKDGNTNKVVSVYYHCASALDIIAEKTTDINNLSATSKAESDLYLQETFEGWNFEDIWTTHEDSTLNTIVSRAPAQSLDEYIPGSKIATDSDFWDVIAKIGTSKSSEIVYEIDPQYTEIDLGGMEWTTIAPDINNPIKSSIRCAEGSTFTIKNFRISGANSSFFGYISGANASMQGLNFENVTVTSNADVVAVVATGLLDNASIKQCKVSNASITTGNTTSQVAVVVGINNGVVENCKVIGNEIDGSNVISDSKLLTMAGIAATNNGNVKDAEIRNYTFAITSQEADVFIQFGGIAGVMDGGKLTDCYNYNAKFNTKIYGTVYAGGVVANMQNKSEVNRCFSEAMLKVSDASSNSYVGGVCAVAKDSPIKYSYYKGNLEGYNVAGVCQTSHSTVEQCYFSGEATGIRVAGIVGFTHGTVKNCYAEGAVVGTTTKSKASSLVSIINVGAKVEYCFANVSFAKCKGEKHAETESEFRAAIENFIDSSQYPDCGELTNCIIINYGEAQIKSSLWGIIKSGWIDCTDEQARGQDNYAVFKDTAAFPQSIWLFDATVGEGYPTLKNVVQKPVEVDPEA